MQLRAEVGMSRQFANFLMPQTCLATSLKIKQGVIKKQVPLWEI
jgi:hypothetical protein